MVVLIHHQQAETMCDLNVWSTMAIWPLNVTITKTLRCWEDTLKNVAALGRLVKVDQCKAATSPKVSNKTNAHLFPTLHLCLFSDE